MKLLSFLFLSLLALSSSLFAKGSLKGFIKDQENGETISYANIVIKGTPWGDVSDEHGYYVITKIPPGHYTIKAMMMGYESGEKEITILGNRTITLDFDLKKTTIEMPEVVKTAERARFERQIQPGMMQMTPRDIRSVPAFVEADLFRSLQMLPGVVTRTDFSSALYIRGGNPSENLILLDDVRIYNPYHLGGVFSTFNTDAIKNVDLSVGGFPPRYGNAVSSVIAITTKEGNSKKFESRGSVSLLSSKLTLEHPIPHGSILLSGRRTYFDYIYNTAIRPHINDSFRFPYYFYDLHGKINYEFTPNSKITLSGFYGDDVLHIVDDRWGYDEANNYRIIGKDVTDIRLGNRSTTLKWRYIFNPKLFAQTIFATSRFRTRFDTNIGVIDDNVDAKDVIHDLTLKSDVTYYASGKHEIKFGLDLMRLDFTLYFKVGPIEWLAYRGEKSRQAQFYSFYLQDDWKISPLLNVQSGVRFTYYNLGKYFRPDPRVALRYRLQDNINLKLSCGIFNQFFYTFNPEDFDYIRLVDLWFPIDERYKPIRAVHYNAGFEYWLNDDYRLSVEGYYKDYDHLLDLNEMGREDVDIDDFLTGWGRAAGLEFLFKKQQGKIYGWLAYSLAFVEKTIQLARASSQIETKNFSSEYQTFYPNYDRRHTLTLVAGYKPGSKWKFNTRFTFASGLPETPTIGWKAYYEPDDNGNIYADLRPVKAPKNSERLPAYIRWDVSISREGKLFGLSLQPFFQIINVTNHHNIFFYDYKLSSVEWDGQGNIIYGKPKRRGVSMFPILPTFGVNFKF